MSVPSDTEKSLPVVGVFDSGVGGLSIFTAVRDRLPGACYVYCSDNANFPYGTKTEAEVVQTTRDVARRFVQAAGLDLLVIACNTASTIALPAVRESLTIPVIGVVPAIKPAAVMSRTHTIGLLATPATVARPYIDELIRQFATSCRVLRLGSRLLVDLAEQKLRGEAVDVAALAAEIKPLFDLSPKEDFKRLDTVVLGCTHFPLLKPELDRAVPWPVQWLDSGEAIAARTDHLLGERGHDARVPRGGAGPSAMFVTRLDETARRLAPALARLGVAAPEVLP